MADAKSNEATLEHLDGLRSELNNGLNTIRKYQSDGSLWTASSKTAQLKIVTDVLGTHSADCAICKAWDGSASSS